MELTLKEGTKQCTASYGRTMTCGHSVQAGMTFYWDLKTDRTKCMPCALESGDIVRTR